MNKKIVLSLITALAIAIQLVGSTLVAHASIVNDIEDEINKLEGEINALELQLGAIKGDLNWILNETERIENEQLAIEQDIIDTNSKINETVAMIEVLDTSMQDRLVFYQRKVNSNFQVDFIMGATSFDDFIERMMISGKLQREETKIARDLEKQIEELISDRLYLAEREAELKYNDAYLAALEAELTNNEQYLQQEINKQRALLEAQKQALQNWREICDEEYGGDPENDGCQGSSHIQRPLNSGRVSYGYGNPLYYPGGTFHKGVDLIDSSQVVSSTSGIVTYVHYYGTNCYNNIGDDPDKCGGNYSNYHGNHVIITTTGLNGKPYTFTYSHLANIQVSQGQAVVAGQNIGIMGNTGNSDGTHLHYEINEGGTPVNPNNFCWYGGNNAYYNASWSNPYDCRWP